VCCVWTGCGGGGGCPLGCCCVCRVLSVKTFAPFAHIVWSGGVADVGSVWAVFVHDVLLCFVLGLFATCPGCGVLVPVEF
jgi:hypothetical protein